MHSVYHVAMDTVRSHLEIMLCRNVLGWGLAIVVCYASSALGNPPQEPVNQPQLADIESPRPFADEPLYPIAGEACHEPEVERVQPVQRNALVRWWNHRFKPRKQFTHWGYPEYFEETPLGTSVHCHMLAQISSGWAARCVLYHYDFHEQEVMLNPSGERRLKELAGAFFHWSQHPLVIEATPQRPELAAARRNHVAQLLYERGVPAQVEVAVPMGFMPKGEEALLMNQNLMRQVGAGGGVVGGTAGMPGGVGVAPGGGRAP